MVRVTGSIRAIREHVGMYVPSDGRSLEHKLLGLLIDDTYLLGVTDLSIVRTGGWILVGSSTDWLRLGEYPPRSPIELFDGPFPLWESGPVGCRHEAVVRALTDKVLVFGPEGHEFLSPYGKAEPEVEALDACRKMNKVRVIGYRNSKN
jgi:hypothetical protein